MSTTQKSTITLIKVGGSIQDDPARIAAIMREVASLAASGASPVVVHGGGKAISAAMSRAGLTPRFVAGQRYTDQATLAIVEEVLARTVNKEICDALAAAGAQPAPLHSLGDCVLFAHRTPQQTKPGEPPVDLGLVGRVTRIDAGTITRLCSAGCVPVIAPVARETDGPGKLNVNADLAAGAIASSLRPAAFILVSDTPGVRINSSDFAPALTRAHASDLIASGVIDGGMLPKIQACLDALAAGVAAVCIVDGRIDGSLTAAARSGPIPGTRMVH